MGRFMQYYRENAKYLERSYSFVERLGIEHLRDVLVKDSQGICARLDAEIEAAVLAYRDPWASEAAQPLYKAQFTAAVPAAITAETSA
jgi:nitrite reductase (NADH) large subunit